MRQMWWESGTCEPPSPWPCHLFKAALGSPGPPRSPWPPFTERRPLAQLTHKSFSCRALPQNDTRLPPTPMPTAHHLTPSGPTKPPLAPSLCRWHMIPPSPPLPYKKFVCSHCWVCLQFSGSQIVFELAGVPTNWKVCSTSSTCHAPPSVPTPLDCPRPFNNNNKDEGPDKKGEFAEEQNFVGDAFSLFK